MNTYLNNAKSEFNRADHLIFVSLKYTRTVDILENILTRLINCFDNAIMALLEFYKELGKLSEIPGSVFARVNALKQLLEHKETEELLNFYLVMRKIKKASPLNSNEFRRGVRMSVIIDKIVIEVDIDTIEEYFKQTETFLRLTMKLIEHYNRTGEELDMKEALHSVHIDIEFERG